MANIRIRDQGKITLKDSDNSNEVSLQSPSTVAADQDFIVPNADGSANNIITTNASGTLSFTDINTLVTSDINWNTTPQYNNITLVSGTGYFINTTAGATTMTLPASPSVGDFVALKDYAGTFGTNKLTIDRNGSNIQGSANNSDLTTNRASVVLQYIDATQGWLYTVENNVGDLEQTLYVTASGGTETTSGNFKIHTFTSSGTFTVSCAGNSSGSNTVSYMVVAGGGGAAKGGGGAGGYRESKSSFDSYTSFPGASSGGLSVSAQAYPVTVGAGGNGAPDGAQSSNSTGGAASVFSTVTSTGGGGGAGDNGGGGGAPGGPSNIPQAGQAGGGGSGGGGSNGPLATGGPTVAVPGPSGGGETVQGFAGQGDFPAHSNFSGGGGGGASEVGGSNGAAQGGDGATTSINASSVTRGGGGGAGGSSPGPSPSGAAGGSGGGGPGGNHPNGNGTAGTTNTGSGGGGGSQAPGGNDGDGANGGSGIVIIRYKYQN